MQGNCSLIGSTSYYVVRVSQIEMLHLTLADPDRRSIRHSWETLLIDMPRQAKRLRKEATEMAQAADFQLHLVINIEVPASKAQAC